jgi:uncharacterized protein (DUF1330 family)
MNTNVKIALAVVAGAALGAAAVQGLRAQAKPKAYSVAEIDVLDTAALASYVKLVDPVINAAGGRAFNTGGGRITNLIGEAPKRVVIFEWDSLERVQAFLDSAGWKNLASQRDKAEKIVRAYVVEATN